MDALFSCLFSCVDLQGTDGRAADALGCSSHGAFGERGPRRHLEIDFQRRRRRKGAKEEGF